MTKANWDSVTIFSCLMFPFVLAAAAMRPVAAKEPKATCFCTGCYRNVLSYDTASRWVLCTGGCPTTVQVNSRGIQIKAGDVSLLRTLDLSMNEYKLVVVKELVLSQVLLLPILLIRVLCAISPSGSRETKDASISLLTHEHAEAYWSGRRWTPATFSENCNKQFFAVGCFRMTMKNNVRLVVTGYSAKIERENNDAHARLRIGKHNNDTVIQSNWSNAMLEAGQCWRNREQSSRNDPATRN